MHKRVIKKFQQRYFYSPGIDAIWSTDLILIPKFKNQNNQYKYILTVVDLFSKYAFVRVTKKIKKQYLMHSKIY